MPITPWRPTVPKIKDGDDVSAAVLQPILDAYTARTQHLFEKFEDILDKSVIIAFDQPITGTGVQQYSVVYFDADAGGMALTKTGIEASTANSLYKASNSSYVFGVVKEQVPTSGVKKVAIWLQGLLEGTGIVTSLLDSSPDNANVTSGPLFLSSVDEGKLTSVPGGLAVFVGYAKSADEFYLNPSLDSLSEFFYNFRFSLLDRPAGTPVYDGGTQTWSISNSSDLVGWVPVSTLDSADLPVESYAQGSLFFYNLPTDDLIDADHGLSAAEKLTAKNLRRSLPPNPTGFSFLTVNGVIQAIREPDNTNGIYFITREGIFWYNNNNGKQPWANDLNLSLRVKTSTSDNSVTIIGANDSDLQLIPFQIGDSLKFFTNGGNLHSVFNPSTTYHVKALLDSHKFTLYTTDPSVTFTITSNLVYADLDYIVWTPNAWLTAKGSDNLRPRMVLMFVKINPDLKAAVVTSLVPYHDGTNDSSKAIQLLSADEPTAPASKGDLLLKYKLPFADPITQSPSVGTGVKALAWNEITGQLEVQSGPVVTSIAGLNGVKVTTSPTGAVIVSFAPFAVPNLVTGMEPENADLTFLGLNSYLAFPYSRLPCGFVGKLLLPESVGDFPLTFTLLMLGTTNVSSGSNNQVKLTFEYNVMPQGSLLTTTTASANHTHTFPNPYVANTSFTVTPLEFTIPAASLVSNGVVNFRIKRPKPVGGEIAAGYLGTTGIIAVYWSIG